MTVTQEFYGAAEDEANEQGKVLKFGQNQIESMPVDGGFVHYGPGENIVGKTSVSDGGKPEHTFEEMFVA